MRQLIFHYGYRYIDFISLGKGRCICFNNDDSVTEHDRTEILLGPTYHCTILEYK